MMCGFSKVYAFAPVCRPVEGENESDPHWVYCSKFLLASLSHLVMCLEKLDDKHFPSPQEYRQTLSVANLLVRKAEMVFSSHLAYWSALQATHKHTVVESNSSRLTHIPPKYNFSGCFYLEYFHYLVPYAAFL